MPAHVCLCGGPLSSHRLVMLVGSGPCRRPWWGLPRNPAQGRAATHFPIVQGEQKWKEGQCENVKPSLAQSLTGQRAQQKLR